MFAGCVCWQYKEGVEDDVGEVVLNFEPGPMGITWNDEGFVTKVEPNGQAYERILKGDQILNPDTVKEKEGGLDDYQITLRPKVNETRMDYLSARSFPYMEVFTHILLIIGFPLTYFLPFWPKKQLPPYLIGWSVCLHSMWLARLFAEDQSELPAAELIIPWALFGALLFEEVVSGKLEVPDPLVQQHLKKECIELQRKELSSANVKTSSKPAADKSDGDTAGNDSEDKEEDMIDRILGKNDEQKKNFLKKCRKLGNDFGFVSKSFSESIHRQSRGGALQRCACGALIAGVLVFVVEALTRWNLNVLTWCKWGFILIFCCVCYRLICLFRKAMNWVCTRGKSPFIMNGSEGSDEEDSTLISGCRNVDDRFDEVNRQYNGFDDKQVTTAAFHFMEWIIYWNISQPNVRDEMMNTWECVYRAGKWINSLPAESEVFARLKRLYCEDALRTFHPWVVNDDKDSRRRKWYQVPWNQWPIFPAYVEAYREGKVPSEIFVNQFLLLHYLPPFWGWSLLHKFVVVIVHCFIAFSMLTFMWSPALVRGDFVGLKLPAGFCGCWVEAMWIGVGSVYFGQWLLNLFWFGKTIDRLRVGFHLLTCLITGDKFRGYPLPRLNLAKKEHLLFWGELRLLLVTTISAKKKTYEIFLAYSFVLVAGLSLILAYNIIQSDWKPALCSCAFGSMLVGFGASVTPNLILGIVTNREGEQHLEEVANAVWLGIVRSNDTSRSRSPPMGYANHEGNQSFLSIQHALLSKLRQDKSSIFSLLGLTLTVPTVSAFVSVITGTGSFVMANTNADDKVSQAITNMSQIIYAHFR